MNRFISKKTALNITIALLVLIPACVFFYSFYLYSVNVPVNDDYRAILSFLNGYIQTTTFGEKLKALFAQNSEHRIVYEHLLTILNYKAGGKVNFNFLSLAGNLTLIGIFFVFYFELRRLQQDWFYLIPLSVLLFNLAFWENITFAMAALSNFTAPLFSLWSLYFLASDGKTSNKKLIAAIVLMIAAVFTQGGGLFLIPVSLFVLFMKREYRLAAIYVSCCLLVLLVFFKGYGQSFANAPDYANIFANGKAKAILFVFSFLGSAFNYFMIYTNDQAESVGLAGVMGVLMFLVFVYMTLNKYYKKNHFVYSTLLLVIIFACATAVNRQQFGLETSGASRYRINSVIFLSGIIFWILENYKHAFIKPILSVFAVWYFVGISLPHREYLDFRKKELLMGALQYKAGNYLKLPGFEQEEYNKILIASKKLGTYELTVDEEINEFFPYGKPLAMNSQSDGASEIRYFIDDAVPVFDSYFIKGWAYNDNGTAEGQKVYLGLNCDSINTRYFLAKSEIREDLNTYFKRKNLEEGGFIARIKFSDVKNKTCKIVLRVEQDGKTKTVETDKSLNTIN